MTTITLRYAELARLISVAARCAATDRMVPVFNQVRLRSHAGKVEALATDRYAIAWVRGESPFPEGFEFGLSASDWRHMLSLYRPSRRSDVSLRLEIEGDRCTVVRSEGILAGPKEIQVSYELVEGEFPKLDHLARHVADVEKRSAGPLAVNPAQLAKLPPDAIEGAVMVPGLPGKPMWFVGVDYLITLMGMRVDADRVADRMKEWLPTDQPAKPAQAEVA